MSAGDRLKGNGRLELGEVLEFMQLIWALDHGLQSTSKRMSAALGVTGPQRLVLRIVGRFPGISAGELAETLHVHPSTLTGVLKRLVGRRLLTRRTDRHDARRARFGLSERGSRVDGESAGTVEAAVRRALASTPRSRRRAAEDVLRHVAAELGVEPA